MNTSLTSTAIDTDALRTVVEGTQAIERARRRINAIRIDAINRMLRFELPSTHLVYVGTQEVTTTKRHRRKKRRVTETVMIFESQIAQSLVMGSNNTGLSVSFNEIAVLKQHGKPYYEVVDLKRMQTEAPTEFDELCELLRNICEHRHLMEFQHS